MDMERRVSRHLWGHHEESTQWQQPPPLIRLLARCKRLCGGTSCRWSCAQRLRLHAISCEYSCRRGGPLVGFSLRRGVAPSSDGSHGV